MYEEKVTPEDTCWLELAYQSIDSKFTALLQEVWMLHEKKARDYGTDKDPLANIRASERVGLEPWRNAALRRMDKWQREEKYLRDGELTNESFEDTILDDVVYALIELVLWKEWRDRTIIGNEKEK